MKKVKDYPFTHFDAETLSAAYARCTEFDPELTASTWSVELDDATW